MSMHIRSSSTPRPTFLTLRLPLSAHDPSTPPLSSPTPKSCRSCPVTVSSPSSTAPQSSSPTAISPRSLHPPPLPAQSCPFPRSRLTACLQHRHKSPHLRRASPHRNPESSHFHLNLTLAVHS